MLWTWRAPGMESSCSLSSSSLKLFSGGSTNVGCEPHVTFFPRRRNLGISEFLDLTLGSLSVNIM